MMHDDNVSTTKFIIALSWTSTTCSFLSLDDSITFTLVDPSACPEDLYRFLAVDFSAKMARFEFIGP